MNLDINKNNRTYLAQKYINVLSTGTKGFFPIITKPTRVVDTSATSIDHTLTNNMTQLLCRWFLTNFKSVIVTLFSTVVTDKFCRFFFTRGKIFTNKLLYKTLFCYHLVY